MEKTNRCGRRIRFRANGTYMSRSFLQVYRRKKYWQLHLRTPSVLLPLLRLVYRLPLSPYYFFLLFQQLKKVFEYFGTYTIRKNSRIELYEHKLECTLFPILPIFPISRRRAIKISRLKSLKLHIKLLYLKSMI